MTDKRVNGYYILLALPAVLLLVLLFLIPLCFNFSSAFQDGAEPLKQVFTDKRTYSILLFTLKEALLSALLSVVLALPFAAFFSAYRFRGRSMIITIAQLSFTIPTILVVLGFVIWYGNNGYLNTLFSRLLGIEPPFRILYSFKAVILAHVYLNLPIAFALITSAWTALPRTEEYASYMLGKGKLRTFLSVTLPRLKGTVASSFILIFLYCFSSFSIVMILGGKPSFSTLEAEIYRRVHINADMQSAAALSIFTLLVTSVLLLLTSPGRKEKKAERKARTLEKTHGKSTLAALLISLVLLLFLLPPMLAIVYRSFFSKSGTFSLDAWKSLFNGSFGALSAAPKAIVSSLILALLSASLSTWMAVQVSLCAAKKDSRLLPFLSSLPMATGSVTLGLGFLFLSARLPYRSDLLSYLFVLAAHTLISLPMAVRTVTPGARQIPEVLSAASYTLGASARKTVRKVEKPMLRNYRRKAFAFSFALSLGEVNATLMLSSGGMTTLPVLIYKLINNYNYQGAAALGTILLLEALLVFAIGERGGRDAVS